MKSLILLLMLLPISLLKQSSEQSLDEVYHKVELENGTLGEDGREIDFIFKKTTLKQGHYEVEIADGPNDLYEVKGTDVFLKFRGYFGYAGYGKKGILIIGSSIYSSKFITAED